MSRKHFDFNEYFQFRSAISLLSCISFLYALLPMVSSHVHSQCTQVLNLLREISRMLFSIVHIGFSILSSMMRGTFLMVNEIHPIVNIHTHLSYHRDHRIRRKLIRSNSRGNSYSHSPSFSYALHQHPHSQSPDCCLQVSQLEICENICQ